MKKLTEEEYKKLSQDFCLVWDKLELEETKKKFMEAINDMHYWSCQRDEDEKIQQSPYDYPIYLKKMEEAIESFQHFYHILSFTQSWKDNK